MVTCVPTAQLPTVYDIFTLPGATPVTSPVDDTTAIAVLSLLHAPPAELLLNVVVVLTQAEVVPEIEDGGSATVMACATAGQDPNVYEMLALPAATPETTPDASTTAAAVLSLLHTPPATGSVNCVVAVGQMFVTPEIAPATGAG